MGEQTSFRDYALAFSLGGLFFICIMYFAVDLANNYGVPISQVSNPYMNLSQFENELKTQEVSSGNWSDNTMKDEATFDFGQVIFKSFWGTIKGIKSSIGTFLNLIMFGTFHTLSMGTEDSRLNIIYYGFMGLIVIAILFAVWRVVRQGE